MHAHNDTHLGLRAGVSCGGGLRAGVSCGGQPPPPLHGHRVTTRRLDRCFQVTAAKTYLHHTTPPPNQSHHPHHHHPHSHYHHLHHHLHPPQGQHHHPSICCSSPPEAGLLGSVSRHHSAVMTAVLASWKHHLPTAGLLQSMKTFCNRPDSIGCAAPILPGTPCHTSEQHPVVSSSTLHTQLYTTCTCTHDRLHVLTVTRQVPFFGGGLNGMCSACADAVCYMHDSSAECYQ